LAFFALSSGGWQPKVQKPLDFWGIPADTNRGIRWNALSERDSEVVIWQRKCQGFNGNHGDNEGIVLFLSERSKERIYEFSSGKFQ
jgi:hypothetical protein